MSRLRYVGGSKPSMIINHEDQDYLKIGLKHNNGAYYYSKEICENIIPRVKTDRSWITVNSEHKCTDHAIVWIHNNEAPDHYDHLVNYKDLILICVFPSTLRAMIERHPKCHCIYLPLSIDIDYVKKFKAKRKTKSTCYFGRMAKCPLEIAENEKIDKIYGNSRDDLLTKVSKYKTVYAVDRCALEAKALGCKVIPCCLEYNKGDKFALIDNKETAKELQRLLNEIDGKV